MKKNKYRRALRYPKGEPKKRILIVCEGTKTEPNYFRSFKVKSSVVVDISFPNKVPNIASS